MRTPAAAPLPSGPAGMPSVSQRWASATSNIVAVALVVCGAGLAASGFVDLLEDGRDTAILAVCGVVCLAAGLSLRRAVPMPDQVPPRAALRSVIVTAATMIAVSSGVYLLTGTISSPEEAIFESTAGFSTTALTVLPDLESVDLGVLFWRSLTQWFGGFLGLATIVAVLPFLGVGGPRPAGAAAPVGAKHIFSAHVVRLMRRYLGLYLALTAIGALLFLLGGMGPFDAVTYAFTTISGGGFANHDRSFAHFDSALIEWLGVAGMLLAGLSLPLAWTAVRGRRPTAFRSTEFSAYVTIVAGTTAVLALTTDAGSLHDTVRHSAFTAASAASTTGHWVTDWSTWAGGPQMLLLVVIGIGAMSGAMGGGFRILRALALIGYVRRELARQLTPRLVTVPRVGRTVLDDETVDRMIGYQVIFIGAAAAGLMGLALTGADLLTALSGSVSALATFGPALGDFAPGTSLGDLGRWELVVLMALMLAGRVELYPVLDVLLSVVRFPGRVRTAWHRRRRAARTQAGRR